MVKIEEAAYAGMWITHDYAKKFRLWKSDNGKEKIILEDQKELSPILTYIIDIRIAALEGNMNLKDFLNQANKIHAEVMDTVGDTVIKEKVKQ